MTPISDRNKPATLVPAVGRDVNLDHVRRVVSIPCAHQDGILLGTFQLELSYHLIKGMMLEIMRSELLIEQKRSNARAGS